MLRPQPRPEGAAQYPPTKMTNYRIVITGDKYPKEFSVEATGWPTAVGRAIRLWKKAFKGSRTTELSIKAYKVNGIDHASIPVGDEQQA